MKPRKTWHTINEETLQRATAAWVWLHAYMEGRGASLPLETRIGDALMSKWVPPCVILRHNAPGGSTIASMGNRVWAALGLPLQEFDIDGVVHYTFEARARVVWYHVIAPEQWDVVPFVASRHEVQGVVMKVTGTPEPLPKHCLQNKNTNSLTDHDLHRLLVHLQLSQAESPEENDAARLASIIATLAEHYCCDTADCLEKSNRRLTATTASYKIHSQRQSSKISTQKTSWSSQTLVRP